jgi:aminopeptidase N
MHTLVGEKGFAAGMALYFQRHDGQAVTCDDFAQAVADANPGSLLTSRLHAFKRWYAQSGTPRVVARGRYDAPSRSYILGLEQQCAATPGQPRKEPFVIPVVMGLVGRDGRALPLRFESDGEGQAPTQRLLVLDEHRAFYTFTDIGEEPVPSLLRGFSAPVSMVDSASDEDLIVQLSHDSDAFNQWESAQRLMAARLRRAHDAPLDARVLDAPFVEALRGVLRNPKLDAAFKAMALTLPSEAWTAESSSESDPQRIHLAHERVRAELAERLHDDWSWAYETHQPTQGYRPTPDQVGQRALANVALEMLCLHAVRTGDAVWQGKTYQRFKSASNMTDRLGALDALLNARSELANGALERLLAIAGDDALIVDKWFAAQAAASESIDGKGSVFQRLRGLLQHRVFALNNPNRVRALLFTWMSRNPAAFHRTDAAGYVVWAEQVLAIDALNPQMGARLARVLDRWRHLAEPYRSSAREAIERVASKPDLSPDVREVVTKALIEA